MEEEGGGREDGVGFLRKMIVDFDFLRARSED